MSTKSNFESLYDDEEATEQELCCVARSVGLFFLLAIMVTSALVIVICSVG